MRAAGGWGAPAHPGAAAGQLQCLVRRRDALGGPASLKRMVSAEEFVERLCRLGADRGPRRFPRKRQDREILMKSIIMTLESAKTYTEAEMNGALLSWKRDVGPAIETDHVTLRRLLVDHGHLERS